MLTLLLALSAHAQSIHGAVPELNAQHFRPSIDASRTLWVDDTTLTPGRFTGRLLVHHTRNPLVYKYDFGDTVQIVSDVLQADLTGGVRLGPVRLGAHVPVYLFETGVNGSASGLGDIGVDGKLRVLDRSQALGLALDARLFFPTATVDAALGSPSTGWEVTAVADKEIGPLLLALNLGVRGGPAVVLENIELNDDLVVRAAGAYAITDNAGAALEVAGGQSLSSFGDQAALPLEVLGSGYGYLTDSLVLRGGIGRGLTRGIGSPDLRLMVGIASEPRTKATVPTPHVDTTEAEEPDVVADADGIPEPTARIRITLIDGADGSQLPSGTLKLRRADGEEVALDADMTAQLPPGTYALTGSAPGFELGTTRFEVDDDDEHVELKLVLIVQERAAAESLLVRGKILFATNDSTILAESLPVLDDVATRVKAAGLSIRIEGHTDNRGSAKSNLELSRRRAEAVHDYLVARGVDPAKITLEAYGESRPLVPGDTPEAWEKDRRVDIYSVPDTGD